MEIVAVNTSGGTEYYGHSLWKTFSTIEPVKL